MNISELKFVCEYELECCSHIDDPKQCANVAETTLQFLRLPKTKKALSSLSNQQLKEAYIKNMKDCIQYNDTDLFEDVHNCIQYNDTDLFEDVHNCSKMCGSCGKFEEADMEEPYKKCSACLTENYCSRECQKNDWKNHKMTCSKNEKN
jgi:NADH pyrophosphatase NudC (nudix superfamily)